MKTFIIILSLLTSIVVLGEKKKTVSTIPIRVGVYDSRAIAVAYCGSVFCKDYLRGIHKRYKAAKGRGDKKEIAKLKREAEEHQKRLHKQGFSVAPVDDLLKHIKKHLADIKKKSAVDVIVSKWDKKSLAKYKTATKKDITMVIVKAFNPEKRTLNIVKQIQTKKPILLKQAEKIKD